MIKQSYRPIAPVNIGVNKDTVNDFARKYNLEIEQIYGILNKYKQRKVVFKADGDYWNVEEGKATLTTTHNGNIVYGVYRTADGVDTQVLAGISMDNTNVILEAEAPFDGYMLMMSDDIDRGVGGNLPDDIVDIMDGYAAIASEAADRAEVTVAKIAKDGYSVAFATVADMKAADLAEGMIVKTAGYYEANDGGGAFYIIRKAAVDDLEDSFTLYLTNGLVAEIIIEKDTVNILSLGAKTLESNNNQPYDNKYIIDNAVVWLDKKYGETGKQITLYFPYGHYCFSPTLIYRWSGISLKGQTIFKRYNGGTFIRPMQDNQPYIWKLGGNADLDAKEYHLSTNYNLDGFVFEAVGYGETPNVHIDHALIIDGALYSYFGKLMFSGFNGSGLGIRSSWEIHFDVLNFRNISGITSPCLHFMHDSGFYAGDNISALYINYIMFETCSGDLIRSDHGCSFVHNEIGTINIEEKLHSYDGTVTTYTNDTDLSDCVHLALFRGQCEKFVINTINYNKNNAQLLTDSDGIKYVRDTLFYNDEAEFGRHKFSPTINIINIYSNSVDVCVLRSVNETTLGSLYYNTFYASLIAMQSENDVKPYMDVKCFPTIKIGKIVNNTNEFIDNVNAKMLDFYNHPCNTSSNRNSRIVTMEGASNPFNLVIARNGGSSAVVSKFLWNYPSDLKVTLAVRLKYDTSVNSATYLSLRTIKDGATVNANLRYSGDTDWTTKYITIQADNNSWVQINDNNDNAYLDRVTFGSAERVTV